MSAAAMYASPNKRPVVALAPLAGVTDGIFRKICSDFGADLTVTEMVSAQGLFYNPERSGSLAQIHSGEGPVLLQLFGRLPDVMADMAARYGQGFAGIDINMGCPAPKITKAGQGSALMREPDVAAAVVREMSRRLELPVSVKMRLGWEDGSGAVDFALRMQEAGANMITVHGRTREQQYAGKADWDAIARVREQLEIPVFANGDVFSAQDALRILSHTGCAGVMIGRGSLGNPWIFSQIQSALRGEEPHLPTRQEIAKTALHHAREMVEFRGERFAIPLLRKHLAWYIRNIPGGAIWRNACFTVKNLEEIERIMDQFSRDDGENDLISDPCNLTGHPDVI